MPIYEYKCKDCGSRVEQRQGVSDPPLVTCEKCGGKLEKQWSLSGFQFKGEGWYVTDYAGKKAPAADTKSGGGDKSEKSAGTESTAPAETASKTTGEASGSKNSVSKPGKE